MSPAPADPAAAVSGTTITAAGINARFAALFAALDAGVTGLDIDSIATSLRALLIPTGAILATGRAAADTGFLLCNGAAVSRTTYSALFTAIGTAYGTGDGSTTFNVPDLLGRTPIGAGAGAGLTARTRGTELGSESYPDTSRTNVEAFLGDFATEVVLGLVGGGNMQPSTVVTFQIKT